VRLSIVGASGRTGSLLVDLALERGHEVTALVRDPAGLAMRDDRLTVVQGDVLDPDTLAPAVADQDAIVSLLAPRPRRNGRVYVQGTRNVEDAAERAGVRRFVVVSAEGAGVDPGSLPFGYRLVLRIPMVARLYPDIAKMDEEVRGRTTLDWTIVRPPVLTNGPRTGTYRVIEDEVASRGLRISRADLAAFLLDVVEKRLYVREWVAVAY
jgi:putative NADH-flavin reductase